ncbi:immunity protein Imm33 domain-containing protein [Bacillus sp. GL1(2024)]|uniref:immunity protein Imm33 domain-containing protein n=1 Tax=Bacillus sp. GL1(2024) TaxID=3450427 RepID=UPI003F55A405
MRENLIEAADDGWKLFSKIDDDYINNSENLVLCDFNAVANIELAILGIYELPIGSDLQLVSENGKIRFINNLTGE